ncbi:MAG TPA: MerR family transcriptional regulator [Myxococcales bacterium]|jgi:DNA-binding transcriptional MerR regulator|nr:MerR family transcriptional regulator [Myxococcales bacterium]
MNAADQLLSLEELASRVSQGLRARGLIGAQADARVSAAPDARTVRYYTTLGLLDRPGIEDRKAVYGPRHLLQLLAIKALQAADLPLAEIQQRLYGRSDGELEALIEAIANSQTEEPEPPSALSMREFTLAPGLRLLVEEGFAAPSDLTQLEELFRSAIAAPRKAPRGAGGKK